jgi:hypothetical protein
MSLNATISETNDEIKLAIHRIVNEGHSIKNDTDALQFMKNEMDNTLMPMMRQFNEEAAIFRIERDQQNVPIEELARQEIAKLCELFGGDNRVSIKHMSSFFARLNLPGESDVDIGLCINGFNDEKGEIDKEYYEKIVNMLNGLKYEHSHDFNPEDPSNRYFSFEQIIDDIEFEVKVRDYETTLVFLRLHDQLDNHLTEEQITLYTYMKYLLSRDKNDKTTYKYFKKILYESAFCGVEGAFVFPMP